MIQVTALMETASGKGYFSNGENYLEDKSSNSKKENLLSFKDGNKVKSTFPGDEWDSLALEQRSNDKEINNIDKVNLWEPSFSASQDTKIDNTHSQSSEFEDSIDYAFLNKTYSIHYSESKLNNENLVHLNSELDPEMQKREVLLHEGNKTIGLERIYKISDDDYQEAAEDVQKYDLDEDSQQEYHSAEEQENTSSQLRLGEAETLSTSNLGTVELRNSGYEVKCVSSPEDNQPNLESSSIISLDSLNVFAQEYSPQFSKFQNSVKLKENHESKHEKCKEQETSLMYHTVSGDIVQRDSFLGNQDSQSKSGILNPQKALKTKICTEEMKTQITENKDFYGNTIVENKVLYHQENPSTLPQDRAPETPPQCCNDSQTSWNSIFDDSVISACGCSHYKNLQSSPDPALGFSVTLPRITVRDNQVAENSRFLKVNSNTSNKTCPHDVKGTCPKSFSDAASCTVTVNQTVDVSADFRACFTTSRATSTRSSVVSTSSNTEITMMNKKRPGEWQSEKQRSVACNTDWSCSQDCVDVHMAIPKGSGRALSTDSVTNKDSLESVKMYDTTDLKKHPERASQLSKEMEKNVPSECCQNIMQRAMKAEMHLLNVHYQMCCHHCCDIYKLVMENRKGLTRNFLSNSAKELGSSLLYVLGDLKVRYMNLKEKIHKGILLEELPPLSVESKLLSTFSTFVSRLIKEEPFDFTGADSEQDNQSAPDVDISPNLKKTLSEMSLLSDNSHPKQDTSPKKDGFRNGDINIDFSQLKLDDKECREYHEMSEDWFDAKENLTGGDLLGMQESQTEHDRWNPRFTLEMRNVEPLRRDKCFLIHVGGLCPSVSESDLRSHFQKYQVSEISIDDSSTNYRKNSDAKMAAKEMNGVEVSGKSVTVRLAQTPGEYAAALSSKDGSKVNSNDWEKTTNKDMKAASCASRLPRTRPRQLESEQDSESSSLDQKSVKKNCKQIESAPLLLETPIQFIPPNTLNLRSFTKIMKRLAELHPEVSRDHIIDALQEVRINHKGFLNGLSISTIVEMTSSVLKNSSS